MDVSGISKPKKEEPSSPVLPQSTGKRIKQEEPDSPPPLPQRRLITSGSQRYSIIPPECRKAQPGFKKAREAWSRREAEALKILGLKPVRTFIRCVLVVIDQSLVLKHEIWPDEERMDWSLTGTFICLDAIILLELCSCAGRRWCQFGMIHCNMRRLVILLRAHPRTSPCHNQG